MFFEVKIIAAEQSNENVLPFEIILIIIAQSKFQIVVFEKPLAQISFGYLLLKLFQTAERFDMTVQPQLLLLQKTLFYIESLGRKLYPDLDLWTTAKPFMTRWMREQKSPRRLLEKILKTPGLIFEALEAMHEKIINASMR